MRRRGTWLHWALWRLCIAACALVMLVWALSFSRTLHVCTGWWMFELGNGAFGVTRLGGHVKPQVAFSPSPSPDLIYWWPHYQYVGGGSRIYVDWWFALPVWVPLFFMVGICVLLLWKGRGRAGENDCQACGYDLTANVSGTCPECGTPVPGQVVNSAGAMPRTKESEQR